MIFAVFRGGDSVLLQARWPLRRGMLGFTLVATVVASVTSITVWCLVHDVGSAEVSLRDVAESDFIPLSAVVLFRFACAAVALYTLVGVYCDPEGLDLRYLDAQVHLCEFYHLMRLDKQTCDWHNKKCDSLYVTQDLSKGAC